MKIMNFQSFAVPQKCGLPMSASTFINACAGRVCEFDPHKKKREVTSRMEIYKLYKASPPLPLETSVFFL